MKARREIIRFLFVGAIVNAIDLSVYFLLFHYLLFSIAKGISFTCGGIFGYLLNKYWRFDRAEQSFAEVGRYGLINLLALGVNVFINQGILTLWPGAIWPALLTATALTGLLTFICFKWWVFKADGEVKKTSQTRQTFKSRLLNLWNSHSSPHEIALGIAIGVFIGITPFYGFHILTALCVAFFMKNVNKVAIFLGMNISLPPTIPFITWCGYTIGRKILGSSAYPSLGLEDFSHFSYHTFFHFFYALMVGSLILGIVLSILFYYLTFWVFKRRKRVILDLSFPNSKHRNRI